MPWILPLARPRKQAGIGRHPQGNPRKTMRVPCNRSLLAPRRATVAGYRSRLRLPGLNVGSTTSVRSAPRARGMNRRSEPPERSADRVRRACGDEPFWSCSGCCVRVLFPAPEISEPSASGRALSIATVRLKARGSCTRHRTCRPSLGISGAYQTQGGPSQQPRYGVCIFHLSSPPLVMKGHLHERHPIISSRVARRASRGVGYRAVILHGPPRFPGIARKRARNHLTARPIRAGR